jgi:hypothetical protein
MIENFYFKKNARFEINLNINIPEILLIKDNKLTNKMIQTLKEIFNKFSSNEKMNKEQSVQFLNEIERYDDDNNKLFSCDKNNNGYLLFDDFMKYYYYRIKYFLYDTWYDLKKLGYNEFLEKNEEFDLENLKNNLNEFEENNKINNFFKIMNTNINRLCLYNNLNKILIDYLNKKQIFVNLKEIEISMINIKTFIDLNINCPNLEELNLYYLENNDIIKFNENEIINIFPNILIFKIYFIKNNNIDLINLLRNSLKIET